MINFINLINSINIYSSLQALLGVATLIIIGVLCSQNRKLINWKLIAIAIILQSVLFISIHHIGIINLAISSIAKAFVHLLGFSMHGVEFVFGSLGNREKYGFVFALSAIPVIIYFSALISILYYLGIIQRVIRVIAWVVRKFVKISGIEALVASSNIFVGPSESPVFVARYIKYTTNSQFLCLLVIGLSNLSASVFGLYVYLLGNGDKVAEFNIATNLLCATCMNAFSAIIFAKLFFPDDYSHQDWANQENLKDLDQKIKHQKRETSFVEATTNGVFLGVKLSLSIIAVLIAIIPIIYLVNHILFWIGDILSINQYIASSFMHDQLSTTNIVANLTNQEAKIGLSIEYLFGQIFRIFAFLMGISWQESMQVGGLLGNKVAINEFIAYMNLNKLITNQQISQSGFFISTYALASFSNLSTLGTQIATFAILDPNRKQFLGTMAMRALFAAVLSGFLTGSITGFWHFLLAI